jgi:hypothetical protein
MLHRVGRAEVREQRRTDKLRTDASPGESSAAVKKNPYHDHHEILVDGEMGSLQYVPQHKQNGW